MVLRSRPARHAHWSGRLAGLTSVALLLAGCGGPLGLPGGGDDEKADESTLAATGFLDDWSAGRLTEAAARTTDPGRARAALEEIQTELRPDVRKFSPETPDCSGDTCRMDFGADLFLNALGDWKYSSALTVVKQKVGSENHWIVAWSPSIIHPRLTDELKLGRSRGLPARAPILDRKGRALVENQKVWSVGVAAGRVPEGAVEDLAKLLDVNVDGLRIRVSQAEEGQFVQAVVLRSSDYEDAKSQLDDIGGVIVRDERQALAPTRQYARAVLGAVGTATAQSLANAGPYASKADQVGSFGLQALYQQQLAGQAARADRTRQGRQTDAVLETCTVATRWPALPCGPPWTRRCRTPPNARCRRSRENASLVAVDTGPATSWPWPTARRIKRGRGPRPRRPLRRPARPSRSSRPPRCCANGLEPSDTVHCPSTINRRRQEVRELRRPRVAGHDPFSKDFTESCNTAFIARAKELDDRTPWPKAADSFGIGGTGTQDEQLLRRRAAVLRRGRPGRRAIGQGRVLMSPLAMAMVAAAVASGTPRDARLLRGGPPPRETPLVSPVPEPPTPSASPTGLPALEYPSALRELMFETVSSGTANILKVGNAQVGAKTGTAEYGSETEPGKHAWMVGFVGNIAFAVIVERGETGAKTAGPLARQFVEEIAGYAQYGLRE